MSRPADNSSLGAGLGSSIWSSSSIPHSQTQPLQKVQNFTTATNFEPQLPQQEEQAQTPESRPAGYVPPHLRGFNTAQKENISLNRPIPPQIQGLNMPCEENASFNWAVPPHLRVKPTVVINSQANNFQTNGQGEHLTADYNATRIVQPSAACVELEIRSVQAVSKTERTPEELFLSKMMQKHAQNTEAKKKTVAEKSLSTEVKLQPTTTLIADLPQSPDGVKPHMVLLPRKNWNVNDESNKNFQDFISDKVTGPRFIGKKYTLTRGQEALPTASKSVGNGDGTLQVPSSNRKNKTSSFSKANSHSASRPRDFAVNIGLPCPETAMESDEPNDTLLGIDALVQPGFESRLFSDGFDNNISDTGVEEKPKENIRASRGQDATNGLVDWDGKMMPPPLDWEADRVAFDNSFMPKYIREDWEPKVLHGSSAAVDTRAKEFQLAVPVDGAAFIKPPEQPLTLPDYDHSENEQRQRRQTAETSSVTTAKRLEKRTQAAQGWAEAHQAHHLAVLSKRPEPHPHAPIIDMYLRPAIQTDVKGIADIYNHYAQSPHSIITEDQAAITEDDIAFLINHTKGEKLPIIVAVRGKMPLPPQTKSQPCAQQIGKAQLPQYEGVIGFGFAETFNYGLGGGRNGRSRFTASIQFYVHHEYTGKKVGQSLLDRLIKSLSHGYGARDGYDWTNPTDDPVYNPGGVQRWHQIVIQFTVRPENDPNHKRMTNFLRRYFFDEGGRIGCIARSSVEGPGKPDFADIVFFVKEASASTEFSSIV